MKQKKLYRSKTDRKLIGVYNSFTIEKYIRHFNIIIFIVLLYIYFGIFIFTTNLLLFKETLGKVISEQNQSEKYYISNKYKGYSENTISFTIMNYEYYIDNKKYINSTYSNVFIYPTIDLGIGTNIDVYYCKYLPTYSIVYKCDIKYFLIDSFPLLFVIIYALYIKNKYLQKVNFYRLYSNFLS